MHFTRLMLFAALFIISKGAIAFSPAKFVPQDSVRKIAKADTLGQAWLVKKWVCVNVSNPEIDTIQFTPQQQKMLKDRFSEMTFEFRVSGRGRGVIDGKMQEGRWQLALKENTLYLINDAGYRDEGRIVKLLPNKLILKKGDTTITFVPY